MLENRKNEYTIILHDEPKPPRYYKINKKNLSRFFLFLSLSVIVSITLSLLYTGYIQNKVERTKNKIPQRIIELEGLLKEANSRLSKEQELSAKLQNKIASTKGTIFPEFNLINPPAGFQDLRSQKRVKLENVSLKEEQNSMLLKLDLLNNTYNNEKVAGYLHIHSYSGNGIEVFPKIPTKSILYNLGESFTISKFKPLQVKLEKKSKEMLVKFYVFSRSGDLLVYSTFEKGSNTDE